MQVENETDRSLISATLGLGAIYGGQIVSQITADVSSGARDARIAGNGVTVIAIGLFAAGFPAAQHLLGYWGAISLIAARVVLACVLLVPIWAILDGWSGLARAPWRRGLGIGAVGFGAGTVLLLVVQDYTDPITAALVAATMPLSAVALEVALDGRRLTGRFLLGTALVLVGGIWATGANLAEADYGIGLVMGLLASVFFGWGSRATVKHLPEMSNLGKCALTLIGAMVFCLVVLALFYLMRWPGTQVSVFGAFEWSMLLLYAWGGLALSQIFWLVGVAKLGIGVASFHVNAAPFYVMIVLLLIGGTWDWSKAAGAVVLCAGVLFAQARAP